MYTAKETKIIEQYNSERTPYELKENMMARNPILSEDCPWVEIRGVFASVTITGNTSWIPLVNTLYARGCRKMAIFGGRHGSILNPSQNNGALYGLMWDADHFAGDKQAATETRKHLLDCEITCVDLKEETYSRSSDNLKKLTREYYGKGYKIIYAWCYSLFAFEEVNPTNIEYFQENPEAAKLLNESFAKCSIHKLTDISWSWWSPA
ncbi:hypothetical protein ACJJIF_18470 [Microbulbifer sp. SSSA002]|uniref:hypothetical protein n=1 Tax=Microbulbifer sp. SSSA002 TaxID=3243376 RepID=UPI0040392E9F